MGHTIDFFRDEVRNGFYIPTAIKQAWAAILDVLAEIDRICVKHGIRYYADWGTFLGAVRHGGFVPWDDDLDICMLRDDYQRFREVADEELPAGYVIHDCERHQDHWLFLARVVNNDRMCFEESYLDSHNNFPWLAGVDIFIKDYLYTDDEKETDRDKEVMGMIALADGIRLGEISGQAIAVRLDEIARQYHVSFSDKKNEQELAVALYKLAERQMARVKPQEAGMVGQIFPWVLKNGAKVGEKKSYYQSIIRLPFEDTTIPVPAAYHTVLSLRYGNYNEIRKVWDGHKYPFFETQIKEMERLSGEKLPGFAFNGSMLKRAVPDRSGSLKTITKECLAQMQELLAKAEKAMQAGRIEEFKQAMADNQQLAVEFGTLVEQVKGEKRAGTVRMIGTLQEYCDGIWQEYQEVESGATKETLLLCAESLKKVATSAGEMIMERREILFLPIGPKEWKTMEPFFEKAKEEEADIYVVPLPLWKKTFLGKVTMTEAEMETAVHLTEYPPGVEYTDWKEYDPRLHCPDEIYVQNPYDGFNPCLTTPKDFYVRNLQPYTDRIVYVPVYETGEFGNEDVNDRYNLKHYVTAPGVVYADEVLVWSENIKEQYVNALTAFAGDKTRDIWEKKISTAGFLRRGSGSRSKKKSILFCIGANELTEHREILIRGIREKLRVFEEAGDSLNIGVSFYPMDRELWRGVDVRLADEVFGVIGDTVRERGYQIICVKASEADMVAAAFDAYYGSPSPLVPAFVTQKKPVMLADYSIGIAD